MAKNKGLKISKKDIQKESHSFFSIVVFVLSLYIILVLLIDLAFELPDETSKLIHYIDNLVCLFFLGDFVLKFYKAQNKLEYMKWGWLDLLSSIPVIQSLAFSSWFRYFRIFRVIRAFKSLHYFYYTFYRHKVKSTFETALTIAIVITLISSIIVLEIESSTPGANIKTAEDAIWWAIVTITTVGYGDKYPITTSGRIIAIILMVVGVGMLGLWSAFIVSKFFQPQDKYLKEKRGKK